MNEMPMNIGVIMDGNRRWAKNRSLPIIKGYKNGLKSLKNLIKLCPKYNISQLTVFAFSTENWKRCVSEVKILLELMEWYLKSEIADIHKNNISFNAVGDKSKFPNNLIDLINYCEKITQNNTGLELNVALNYGGREDIVHASVEIAKLIQEKKITLDDIDYNFFQNHLYSSKVKDIDLLIRTSGEMRLSNFILCQIAYSEIYYSNKYWPEFDENEFIKALNSFKKRERRFGSSSNIN